MTSTDEFNGAMSTGRHLLQKLGTPQGSFAATAATCLYLNFNVGPACVYVQPCGSFSIAAGDTGAALLNLQISAHSTYVDGAIEAYVGYDTSNVRIMCAHSRSGDPGISC